MPAIERKVELCDFCYAFHKKYLRNHPFDYAKKEGVATCTLCKEKNVMCKDCCKHSREELEGSILLHL